MTMNFRRNHKVERVREEKKRLEAKPAKPVKPYRSEAERIAVKQRNAQIGLSVVILLVGVVNLCVQAF